MALTCGNSCAAFSGHTVGTRSISGVEALLGPIEGLLDPCGKVQKAVEKRFKIGDKAVESFQLSRVAHP